MQNRKICDNKLWILFAPPNNICIQVLANHNAAFVYTIMHDGPTVKNLPAYLVLDYWKHKQAVKMPEASILT